MRQHVLGERATGVVCHVNDWPGRLPKLARPKRHAWGTVTQVYPRRPEVLGIATDAGETVHIRVDVE